MKYAAVVFVLAAGASTGLAEPVLFVHGGMGSGTIGSQRFEDRAFEIRARTDTNLRQRFSGGYTTPHRFVAITIDGVGRFDLITPTRTFVNNRFELVGLSRGEDPGSDLIIGPGDEALGSWAMRTSFGPLTGPGELVQWTLNPRIETTGGVLTFDLDEATTVSFEAIVPAPGGLAVCGVLAGALAWGRRRPG